MMRARTCVGRVTAERQLLVLGLNITQEGVIVAAKGIRSFRSE